MCAARPQRKIEESQEESDQAKPSSSSRSGAAREPRVCGTLTSIDQPGASMTGSANGWVCSSVDIEGWWADRGKLTFIQIEKDYC